MEVAEGEGDDVPKIPSLFTELRNEIIRFQILPKLPAKSLMRFKCVSKACAYRNLHSNRNTSLLLLDLRNIDTKQQHIMSLHINQDGSPSPAGATHLLTLEPQEYSLPNMLCTNGLACFVFIHEHHIRVFNPCTRESITLPSTSNSPTSYQSTSPDIKPWGAEIGYGRVCEFLQGCAESWRRVEVEHDDLPFDHTFWRIDMKSVCLHGAIHWTHDEEKCVVVYDLGEQRFGVIPFPPEFDALAYDKETSSTSFLAGLELWILKDYQDQVWVKEVFAVTYSVHSFSTYPCLCAIHTGEILIESGVLSQAFLHFHDTKNQSFRESSIVVPEWTCKKDACIRWDVISCYNETIAPVK
ncbi:F-box protein [Pyrus ussuriensis x Pyrus communis]|uniref:F-box protein n=1 Tax=Pyrus ussuriensis x Pyrus communis TaxID=2448454 RepID=A0A5N5H3Z8_9ROSA|nr:F-box protein [Pyrus ussuriensis x Pyrus communis]